ncbi:efflux RND transporter permease subunit [Phyllobacterium zundukense]|uniref:Efflux RND transporter permease subunit n=1 Tax=Phyllobacterium zundukense TaxID=1867719 RepID=A0ACD4D557_9HYPH|nr:efflux RND transporter permease subunit [Phyllobacterium zundukense]UXN61001.1 efflux RND transporter permease subunit [Phyllobacterium zundukense]
MFELLVVGFLILLNGVFALSELAVVSARKARLEMLRDRGVAGARAAIQLSQNPGKFLSTVQIGITLVGIVAGAFSGATLALLMTGHSIGLPIIIGFLMLMGIVTKNAILLVDFAVEEIAVGIDRTTALINAGRHRAQPILMTTLAMSAGMLPSALALGEGGAFRAPMAIAVIGGLITSTLLSLVFVPAVFTIMDDFGRGLRYIFGRFVGSEDERAEVQITSVD